MSMTKAEKRIIDELRHELALERAMRLTTAPGPDVMPPISPGLTIGWHAATWGALCQRVEPACSSSARHGIGSVKKTDSQRPMPLFSTKIAALKFARMRIAEEAAETLADLDAAIEAEAANPTPI